MPRWTISFTSYSNGAGGLTGDEIAVNKPIYMGTTGHFWYVGPGGVDAASPKGREREKPLLTTQQAVTNAAAGDAIIYLPSFTETILANVAVNKALTMVSEGTGSTRARLTCGAAGVAMLTLSATGTSLNNIYFPASTAVPTARVSITASGVVSDNCYFECGANDTGTTVLYGAVSSCQLTHAYFLATASQPAIAVSLPSATSGMFFEEVTLDGGSFGFSAFAFTAAGVLTAIYANQMHQLGNADVSLAAGWTGPWVVGATSGSARFEG